MCSTFGIQMHNTSVTFKKMSLEDAVIILLFDTYYLTLNLVMSSRIFRGLDCRCMKAHPDNCSSISHLICASLSLSRPSGSLTPGLQRTGPPKESYGLKTTRSVTDLD